MNKIKIILALADALQQATIVGHPAEVVKQLRAFMDAPPAPGDLVVVDYPLAADHTRVGEVVSVSNRGNFYDRVIEILVLDPPCGNDECVNQGCVHRYRWSNTTFIRVPTSREQLRRYMARR